MFSWSATYQEEGVFDLSKQKWMPSLPWADEVVFSPILTPGLIFGIADTLTSQLVQQS
jgi:hypothetical protein